MPSGDYLLVRGEDIGGGIADLVAALPDRWRHIELPHVDERVRDLFRNLAQTRVLVRCRQTGNCDHLAIATVEDLHGHLSGNLRSKLRKWHRRLERRGPVSFERYDQPEQLDQAYHEFLEVESSGWKGVDGERTALKLIPAKREFYRRLLHNFAGFSTAAVCLMRLDGRAVAGQVLLESEGTIYQLKIGYDESYASCAPGNLLLDHVLKTAAQRSGIHTYNLVSGAQWHRRWRAASEARYRITLYRRTFTGRFCMLLDDLAFELRCAVHRWLRPIYRRLLGKTSEAA
jgi:CelD/BcsL family acetyltransferase involved in cellulose biosynthesis